jgi:ribose transport system permease protein
MKLKNGERLTPKYVGEWALNNTNILLMFLLIIVGAVTSQSFFSGTNLANVLKQITINGMLAVACTMTLLVNGFDLSIGHIMALSAVLCIGFEKTHGGAVAIAIALGAGAAVGLINGLLMKLTRGGSGEGFMITLATGMMAQALAKWYCEGSEIVRIQIPEEQDWFRFLGQGNVLGFPTCALIWIAVMLILQFIIKKTTFGRKMLLTGAKKKSAYLAGISAGWIKVIAYTVAGLICGMAAVLYAARFNSANDGSGVGGDFNGAVISIIGGNALYGGHGGMTQVFIGAVTFGLITNILQLLSVSSAVQFIVQGAVLLLAINLDRLKKR